MTKTIIFILSIGTSKHYNSGSPKYYNGQSATILVCPHKFVSKEDLHSKESTCKLF